MCRKTGYIAERDVHISRWNLEDSVRSYNDDAVFYAKAYTFSALAGGVPIIIQDEEGINTSVESFWGILPVWKKNFKDAVKAASNFVNIRSETVYEGTLYPPLLKKKQRCLIPCSYYFEHHHFDKFGKKGQLLEAKLNVPFLVEATRRAEFAIPGLYSHWYDKETNKTFTTHSMLTISANDLLMAVHNGGENKWRMPLAMERGMERHWLDKKTPDIAVNEILNYQIHSQKLNTYPVAPLTGSAAKTGEYIIKEYHWKGYEKQIEEIKNAGKEKQWKPSAENRINEIMQERFPDPVLLTATFVRQQGFREDWAEMNWIHREYGNDLISLEQEGDEPSEQPFRF